MSSIDLTLRVPLRTLAVPYPLPSSALAQLCCELKQYPSAIIFATCHANEPGLESNFGFSIAVHHADRIAYTRPFSVGLVHVRT